MASLYQRPGSPFWWIKFVDAAGKVRRESTKLLCQDARETQRARQLAAELARKEACASNDGSGSWDTWVPAYLKLRYENSPKTYARYSVSWRNLMRFFTKKEIVVPRQLLFQQCFDYLTWRQGDGRTGQHTCKNTALGELKLLGVLMTHAVRCGFAESNPCTKLGIKKDKAKEKPEITMDDLATIFKKLKDEPEWMRICFMIALYTGCRESETMVRVDDVDLKKAQIHFASTKGDKPFTVPMRPELVPLFRQLKVSRKGQTAFNPPRMLSLSWWKFFDKIGFGGHYCFHCLRVTFITWGARAGVPESEMMKLVNHASEEIHRIYKRLRPADVKASLLRIPIPRFALKLAARP